MFFTSVTIRRLLPLVLAAVALAACEPSTTISRVDVATNFVLADLGRFSGGDNAMRVIVYGSPFGDPPEQVADTFVAAMQGNNSGPPVTFSADPEPPPDPTWRVILAVNPTTVRGGVELCRLPGTPETAPQTTLSQDGRVDIIAAYCRRATVLTQATGRGNGITGLDDPTFRTLMAQLTRALFPIRNPRKPRGL